MNIRERAERLLDESGLLQSLSSFGAPAVVGSFAMDLMTWNDLDVYIDTAGWDHARWCDMVAAVTRLIQPMRIDGFCDAQAEKYFFGAEVMHGGERWNIDIWGRSAEDIAAAQRKNDEMQARFARQSDARDAMLRIKRRLIDLKMYGFDKGARHYHSPEVYAAVLDEGIRTPEEFLEKHPV